MDIHKEWSHLVDHNANAGEIIAFTMSFVKTYWRYMEMPRDNAALDALRMRAMSGDYKRLISECAEFILEQTEIQLDVSCLID